MNEQPEIQPVNEEELSYFAKHKYLVLIALTIVISLILVGFSLFMYQISGTAQLDLSRPGYQSPEAQSQTEETRFEDYSASGDINLTTIEEFRTLYNKQAESATALDAFSGDPLSPEALEYPASSE